jgi:acetyl-CoA/propionyl-CoA carboxylase biotin carboxyl carrier protein
MQGTIVKVVVTDGQEVAEGDTVVAMEAIKVEEPSGPTRPAP